MTLVHEMAGRHSLAVEGGPFAAPVAEPQPGPITEWADPLRGTDVERDVLRDGATAIPAAHGQFQALVCNPSR